MYGLSEIETIEFKIKCIFRKSVITATDALTARNLTAQWKNLTNYQN